jgi:dienelactone hydrolase
VTITAPTNPLFTGEHWTSFRFIESEVMDDQFKHILSQMYFGASDLGECLEVGARLVLDDEERWISEWSALAERIEGRARNAARAGRRETAAALYKRAATYWRGSLIHHAFPADPRTRENALAAYRSWDGYLDQSGYPGERINIPYESSELPAYLYRSPVALANAPLVVFFQGRDAWTEDTGWVYENAVRRGYHALGVQCPGQGMAIRVNDLPFRPDWEHVVSPILDVAVQLDGVDTDRVALMGLSFGGHLAPRAAVFERRIKLCIANPGVISWGESVRGGLPPQLTDAWADGRETFNAVAASISEVSPLAGWFLRDSMWKHGVDTPYDLLLEFDKFDIRELAGRIEAETLVMDGREEQFSTGQADLLFEALECKKELMLFDASTTAQLHCQNGAVGTAGEYLFDWLQPRL